MIVHKTVAGEATAEQLVKKSKFITYIKPVEMREEAEAFIEEIRKRHRDATHNVPAMVIGEEFQIQWASDDGEPQGTSGVPMVRFLVHEGITNVVVVVTRYFGGIKLGTGGLVRAYTSSAALGVAAAGIRIVKRKYEMIVSVEYPFAGKLERMCREAEHEIVDVQYGATVTFKVLSDVEKKEELKRAVANITGGSEKILSEVEKNA